MEWLVLATFFVGLASSLVSGMGGGGGGFITLPYFLLVVGLPPANALATAKMGGIGTSFGAMTALGGKGLVHKGLVYKCMIITVFCSLVAAWLIPRLDPGFFQRVIGVFCCSLSRRCLSIKRRCSLASARAIGSAWDLCSTPFLVFYKQLSARAWDRYWC